jgi:hypothetical protein
MGAGRFLVRFFLLGKRDEGDIWCLVHACTNAVPWPASLLAEHKWTTSFSMVTQLAQGQVLVMDVTWIALKMIRKRFRER